MKNDSSNPQDIVRGTRWEGKTVILELGGEIDLKTSTEVKNKLHEIFKDNPQILVVDMTAVEFMDYNGWDGKGYRITKPYAEKTFRRNDGGIEFRHHLCDVFNGLIAVGFSIQQVEDMYSQPDPEVKPGSWKHIAVYMPGLTIIARKEKRLS